MAATAEGARLTERHRLAQVRLGAATVAQMFAAWSILDPENIDATMADWLQVAVPLIQQQRRVSATLAANYLAAYRTAEVGLSGAGFVPILASDAPVEQLITSLVTTGPVRIKKAMSAGRSLDQAVASARATSAGAAERHALNGSRETIAATGGADRSVIGFARATSGSPCPFCAMMAGRGPVYKSRDSAQLNRLDRLKPHDSCNCTIEAVYHRDADWPAGSKRYAELYQQAKAADGDTVKNFRHLVEAA